MTKIKTISVVIKIDMDNAGEKEKDGLKRGQKFNNNSNSSLKICINIIDDLISN
jgi:hypothetical protein